MASDPENSTAQESGRESPAGRSCVASLERQETLHRRPGPALKRLTAHVRHLTGGSSLDDDVTILEIKMKPLAQNPTIKDG